MSRRNAGYPVERKTHWVSSVFDNGNKMTGCWRMVTARTLEADPAAPKYSKEAVTCDPCRKAFYDRFSVAPRGPYPPGGV
jgi:hypothetical protein